MAKLILFNKPFRTLSQFSEHEGKDTLAKYIPIKQVYPCGRLDYDSEGLLLLTDNGPLQHQLSHPKFEKGKEYWVQVEGAITASAIKQLATGVQLKDGLTLPATAKAIPEPDIWPRTPPIRERSNIPTSWLSLTLHEGKNRQVRRMTAAVGFPTLRLVRAQIAQWHIGQLQPGEYREVPAPKVEIKPSSRNRPKYKTVKRR